MAMKEAPEADPLRHRPSGRQWSRTTYRAPLDACHSQEVHHNHSISPTCQAPIPNGVLSHLHPDSPMVDECSRSAVAMWGTVGLAGSQQCSATWHLRYHTTYLGGPHEWHRLQYCHRIRWPRPSSLGTMFWAQTHRLGGNQKAGGPSTNPKATFEDLMAAREVAQVEAASKAALVGKAVGRLCL